MLILICARGKVGILPNVKFWWERWSCFRVRVTVVVGALVMASVLPLGLPLVVSSTTCHQRRVYNIFLTIRLTLPPNTTTTREKKKKVKNVIHDKLPSRNNVQCIYIFLRSHAILPNVNFWSFHLLHGTNDGWIIFFWPSDCKKKKKKVMCHPRRVTNKKWGHSVYWFCYVPLGSHAVLRSVEFWSWHLLHGTNEGWIAFS